MTRYFFITFIRNLRRHPGYSLVNILGLSIGITCAWIIFQYISFENSYDSFHTGAEKIYKIYPTMEFSNSPMFFMNTPIPMGKNLKESYPEVDQQVSTISYLKAKVWPVEKPELSQYATDFLFVDQAFFEVFNFPVSRGESDALFNTPNSIFISQQIAQTNFGSENPIGKEMAVHSSDSTHYFVIKGILEDMPDNTQFKASYLLSHAGYEIIRGPSSLDSWGNFGAETFLIFDDAEASTPFEPKIAEFYASKREEESLNSDFQFSLKPLTSLHLDENIGQAKKNRLLTFGLIAWAILIVACINYMNLATARASLRDHEIGVKKTLGANRKQLILQFLGEALIVSLLASFLAIILIDLIIPFVSNLVQKDFTPNIWLSPTSWFMILSLGILAGLLSGIYPALLLSNKGNLAKHFSQQIEKGILRKALVGVQFLVAALFIISILVIQKQLHFMQNQDLGFDEEHVVYVDIQDKDTGSKHEVLKSAFLTIPEVLSASSCNFSLDGKYGAMSIKPGNATEEAFIAISAVDTAFGKTLGIELIEGKWPKKNHLGAVDVEFVVNEQFIKTYGFEETVGTAISKEMPESIIVGIAKDFHSGSLKHPIKPMLIMGLSDENVSHIALKLQGSNMGKTLKKLEQTWKANIIGEPFSYSFLDEKLARMYDEERTFAKLIGIFSGLAIFIASIGLLALVAFTSEARSKEIGIRKVLGASVANILALLNRSFFLLIGGAFLVAIPLAIWLLQKWLEEFAYRITLKPDSFLWAGGILMGFTLITVSYYSLKAALADPVLALKDE